MMNDERLLNKVKSKCHPRERWLAQENSLRKELHVHVNLPDKVLEVHVKLIKQAQDKRQHEEFVMVLQNKSKLGGYNVGLRSI